MRSRSNFDHQNISSHSDSVTEPDEVGDDLLGDVALRIVVRDWGDPGVAEFKLAGRRVDSVVLPTMELAVIAVLAHVGGVLTARWLFFAQAEHVVGLYYGKR